MEFNFFTAILLPVGLAIAITAGLLNNPDMAIPAAIYSLFAMLLPFLPFSTVEDGVNHSKQSMVFHAGFC